MARKAKKGITEQVNWRLPVVTKKRVIDFYGLNKTKLDFESDRDAADYLLNLALDGHEKASKSSTGN